MVDDLTVGGVSERTDLTIGGASERTGLTIDAIRFYDRAGFVSPERDSAGRRRYSEADVDALTVLRQFRRSGLSLAQIRTLFDVKQRGGPASVRLAAVEVALREIRTSIEQRRRDVDSAAEAVDAWLAEVGDARRG